MLKRQTISRKEEGFASLVVGLIMIVVLGLITVGFAELSRHEQIQALDSQLSSAAYYAAESGINDAVNAIESTVPADQITAATPNVDTGNCLDVPLPGTTTNIVNSADDVSYSCVIVNLNPPQLEYGPVNYDTSQTIVTSAVNPNTHNPLTQLTLSWGSSDGNATFTPLATKFPPFTTWNANANRALDHPAVIEFTITPLTAKMTRAQLINNTFTVFMYPSNAVPNNVAYNQGDNNNDGSIRPGGCNNAAAPYPCSVTITGITPTGQYLIHFLDLYDSSNVKITGSDGAGPTDFTGGQAQIDATGKAQDVLKRLDVTVPLGNSNFPNYAIEAQNICKRIETGPVTAQSPNPTTFIDPTTDTPVATDPCDLDINN